MDSVKCSLNLYLLFKSPNVLHIGYMQQKRKVHSNLTLCGFCGLFLFVFAGFFGKFYCGQFIEKEQTHAECCTPLYGGGQNLILYAL